uniref:Uncharacterized protein n=1 Tax=Avena sativa TaxID=4498 RepID=A0ACD5V4F8_AVESA
MGHDGAHHAPASRDAKKKRQGNRSSAKLKQCKLDARREQWLSQVKDGKEATAATAPPAGAGSGAGSNAGSPILASPHPPLPRGRRDARSRGGAPEDDKEDAGATGQDIGSIDFDSPMPSPGSDNSRGGGCAQRKRCSSNDRGPSLSSVSSLWSSSRSVSDAEDDDTGSGPDEENGVLDDWEAVADALSVDDDSHCHQSLGTVVPPAAPRNSAPPANTAKSTEPIRSNARAWTPDDMFRPQSLPSISKQASFPAGIGNCWAMGMGAARQSNLPSPLSCPICYEDLDPTDSSFLPCPCGFHLCLFCHKRILEADARCPGCRKQYNAVSAAAAGGGATAPVRLSRSCSMGPRR